MNSTYFLSAIIPLGIGTFLIRASVIYLCDKIVISKRLKEIFSFIPAAILPALVAPMVFFFEGCSEVFLYKERVIALTLSVLVAFKTRNILVTIFFGLCVLYCFKLIWLTLDFVWGIKLFKSELNQYKTFLSYRV